jgi:hypothetical protein
MGATGTKRESTKSVEPPFGERLMQSLAISGIFWPEVANLNDPGVRNSLSKSASNPNENSGLTQRETQAQTEDRY